MRVKRCNNDNKNIWNSMAQNHDSNFYIIKVEPVWNFNIIQIRHS